jgi:hypothetical protein
MEKGIINPLIKKSRKNRKKGGANMLQNTSDMLSNGFLVIIGCLIIYSVYIIVGATNNFIGLVTTEPIIGNPINRGLMGLPQNEDILNDETNTSFTGAVFKQGSEWTSNFSGPEPLINNPINRELMGLPQKEDIYNDETNTSFTGAVFKQGSEWTSNFFGYLGFGNANDESIQPQPSTPPPPSTPPSSTPPSTPSSEVFHDTEEFPKGMEEDLKKYFSRNAYEGKGGYLFKNNKNIFLCGSLLFYIIFINIKK